MTHVGEQIAARVKKLREALELSGYELEQHAGLSHGYISRLERGERAKEITAETVVVLAQALGVEPGWLLTGRGSPTLHGALQKIERRPREKTKARRASGKKKPSRRG